MILRLRRDFGLQNRREGSLEFSAESLDEVEEMPGKQTAARINSSGSQLYNLVENGLPLQFHLLDLVIVGIRNVESSC